MDTPPVNDDPTSRPLEGLRVLLAEDNPDNVVLATAVLRKEGADVDIAWNGAQAVEQGLGRRPHVVLMDVMMPVMDGRAATRQLRARGFDGTIVALTALAGAADRESCLAAGCDRFMSKPYDPDRLVELLRSIAPAIAGIPGSGSEPDTLLPAEIETAPAGGEG